MITADLVQRRVTNFWGYGSFAAPVWFVGMEEGLGVETDVEERLQSTDGRSLVDMRRDMVRVRHHMAWFVAPAPAIQPNFKYPIALYLYFRHGKAPSSKDIRGYQLRVLGDAELKDSCVVDLMPLPARGTSDEDWQYAGYVGPREETQARPSSAAAGLDRRTSASARYFPLRDLPCRLGSSCWVKPEANHQTDVF